MSQPSPFLTPQQLTQRWASAVTTGTLANWRCRDEGPPFTKVRGRILYPLAEVEAWEARNLHNANDNKEETK